MCIRDRSGSPPVDCIWRSRKPEALITAGPSMNSTTGIPPKMVQTFLCAKPKKGSGNCLLYTSFRVGAVLFSNQHGPLGQTETAARLLDEWKE